MNWTVYLGIGSNLGDRRGYCTSALNAIRKNPAVSLRRVSSLYETEPLEYTPQDWFYNAAVEMDTSLCAEDLLACCKQVEEVLGKRVDVRKGPRTVDLDLLFFGEQVITTPDLIVPHPMIPLRAFVLVPLAEIAPQRVHPVLGKTILELLAQLKRNQEVKIVADEGWFPL